MTKKQRKIEDYIIDIKLFKSNKLSIDQSIAFFAGLSYEMVLNRELFPHNSDLEIFITEFYLKYNEKEEDQYFKPYLYKSRTQLGARLTRNILDKFDYTTVKVISNNVEKMLISMAPSKENTSLITPQSSFNSKISTWLEAISENDANV